MLENCALMVRFLREGRFISFMDAVFDRTNKFDFSLNLHFIRAFSLAPSYPSLPYPLKFLISFSLSFPEVLLSNLTLCCRCVSDFGRGLCTILDICSQKVQKISALSQCASSWNAQQKSLSACFSLLLLSWHSTCYLSLHY